MLWFQAIQFTDALARMQRARAEERQQNFINSNSSSQEKIGKERSSRHIKSGKPKNSQ